MKTPMSRAGQPACAGGRWHGRIDIRARAGGFPPRLFASGK